MAILAECPRCRRKQAGKNRLCKCGEDLLQAKKSKRVRYWLSYRLPDGTQRRELASGEDVDPHSIKDAQAAHAKRETQRKEKRFFDMLPEANMTFEGLTEWYLGLEKVRALKSFHTTGVYLRKFNQEFGNVVVGSIKLADLENLQAKRFKEGLKPKTVDDEINQMKSVIIKAFDNDLVGGDVLKTFRRVKKTLKAHSNRRERVLTVQEFNRLQEKAPRHLRDIVTMGYWTGMRKGEILNLTWDRVDLKERFIRLEASDTKEGQGKAVPLGDDALRVLSRLPRPLHGGFVFLYNGRPIEHRFETAIKTACKSAGIPWGRKEKGGFIFHDLRHTFVTDMRRAGVARTVTMAITGHAITDMNARYDTVEDFEKLEAIRSLEKFRSVDQNVDQALPKTL